MSETVIDQAIFFELRETAGAEFATELVDTFLEEAPGMFAELRNARTDADAERFRRAAHSLKSNGNTFGAVRFAALARELEMAGLNADPQHDLNAIAALEAEFSQAASALKELCSG